MYTYLILLIGSLLFPLSYSFEKKIAFYKRWLSLFTAIFLVAAFFIVWDIYFTNINVWSFNEDYVIGLYIYSLPLEECLFFIIVPYSCVFIYDALNHFIKRDILAPYSKAITIVLVFTLMVIALFNMERIYTSITFILTASFLGFHYVVFKDKYLGRFYIAYLVHLIPFFIVNGILTAYPVVLYNQSENLGILMGTIPVEDSMYSLLMLLMNITIYEYINNKRAVPTSKLVNV
jgi:lycopene cyclase domain-containing protein